VICPRCWSDRVRWSMFRFDEDGMNHLTRVFRCGCCGHRWKEDRDDS